MDEEERKKKLEAGKAKLASFRKKRSSASKKKRRSNEPTAITPRDGSHSEEVGAGDSTAVQTGDDTSLRALSPSDESERSTTTADDISTEEESGFNIGLSSIERIQELELTVSDQQVALQKLTVENKELRNNSKVAMLESSISERDGVISELRDSVSHTVQQVRQLQQQLTQTTNAVMHSETEPSQIVTELTETRNRLDEYRDSMARQEEAMQLMAKKLAEKSLAAGESEDKCRSLQSELDKSLSHIASSEEYVSAELRSLHEEIEKEKSILRAELEEEHGRQIIAIKREHEEALNIATQQFKQMERQGKPAAYDPEDIRAFREQVAMLSSQLETSYRDVDKLKRDHDKEVIQLNQQLVSTVDEYETKLQEEKTLVEDLEHRLEMSDTVSSEIQQSFSKQLELLEEERDTLRQQLRNSQTKAKDSATSKKQIKDLEDELINYQGELAETTQRLEEAEKQKRQLRDDLERKEESNAATVIETSSLEHELETLKDSYNKSQLKVEQLTSEIDLQAQNNKASVCRLEEEISTLKNVIDEEKQENEKNLQEVKTEHSEELKHLHSQHHRQMDEVKQEMQRQLDATSLEMEEHRKEQLENVKDVHEKSRDREIVRMEEEHQKKMDELLSSHQRELDALRVESREVKAFAEERLRLEQKEEFDNRLEMELETLRRRLEQENELVQAELNEKHVDDMRNLKSQHQQELDDRLAEARQEYEANRKASLSEQRIELDRAIAEMQSNFDNARETLQREHTEYVAKLEDNLQKQQSDKDDYESEAISSAREELSKACQRSESLDAEIVRLEAATERLSTELEEAKKNASTSQDTLQQELEIRRDTEQELQTVKEELSLAQQERDQIFAHAETSQKRLATLHDEQTGKLEEELAELKERHESTVETMRIEIDGLRTSRTDLQDLKRQLLARNSSVEDFEKMREEFAEEKDAIIKDHNKELEKIRLEHEEETRSYQEKLEQLLTDFNESQDKLAEISSSPMPLESSPMRSVSAMSAMSDYDSSNVHALNKDYRSALTLTHVSDMSGMSETPLDQEEINLEEQKDNDSDTSSSSSRSSDNNKAVNILEQQLEEMKMVLNEVQEELERNKSSHDGAIQSLVDEHTNVLEELKQLNEQEKDSALEELQAQFEQVIEELRVKQQNVLAELNEEHQREINQARLQCASDTAKQVEEETDILKKTFESDMDSLKHKMEAEAQEKLEEDRSSHVEEMKKQADEMSASMETRLAAMMTELHQQKQLSLAKLSEENTAQLEKLQGELDIAIQDKKDREDEMQANWKKQRVEMESEVERLKEKLKESMELYQKLAQDLDTGNNEHILSLQNQHGDEIEALRKRLEEEHEQRQEAALNKQAQVFQQAQEEFVKLHQQQLEQFTSSQKEEALRREGEVEKRLNEVKLELEEKHQAEFSSLQEAHNEELKVVATKLVEVHEERQHAEELKNELGKQYEELQIDQEKQLADLKSSLVSQHMLKFQEVTATLEQHHKEEMDARIADHQQEEAKLREGLISLQKKLDSLEEAQVVRTDSKEETKLLISEVEHEAKIKALQEMFDQVMLEEKKKNDDLLEQIEKEILSQEETHKSGLDEIRQAHSEQMEVAKKCEESLNVAKELSEQEAKKLVLRVEELEAELQEADTLQNEMSELQRQRAQLEARIAEEDARMRNFEEERDEERKAYEAKLEEISEALNASKEDYQDLNSRIEFERAEYETEIESAQEDLRVKEESAKELEAEVEHKSAALDSLHKQHEQLTSRRERETLEGDNLLKMLRDDLDRLNRERDTISSSNEQLLATLTELVRANHDCEEAITRKLEALPLMGSNQVNPQDGADAAISQSAASNTEGDTGATNTPLNTSLSGSFVDEGLDLSQRLVESMFVGPELDASTREAVTTSGHRVGQAVQRLLIMLNSTVEQLNAAQQAQTMLGDELQRVVEGRSSSPNLDQSDLAREQTNRVTELEQAIKDKDGVLASLMEERQNMEQREAWLNEEKSLLQKQREALVEGRDQTEINLLRATDELGREKQILVDMHQKEQDRLEEAARQLEVAMEEETRRSHDKEQDLNAQIEDLKSQINALNKQSESDTRLNEELVTDREAEREQFEEMMESMRGEIDQARDTAKAESLLAEKVAHLESDLEAKQQQNQEAQDQVDKLQEKISQLENIIDELKEQVQDDGEVDNLRSEASNALSELEESKQQHGVLQQELYDNMLRISALEAQLDRYRHGVDENLLASAERSEVEERIKEEQKKEEMEHKDSQIEVLLEQQNNLRTQIIEKEEQVAQLLQELDHAKDTEAENAKLKDDIDKLQSQRSEAFAQDPQTSNSEQLEALSRHLLEEKNAEIDDLRQQMSLLRSETVDGNLTASEQIIGSLKYQLDQAAAENEALKEQLRETEEQLASQSPEEHLVEICEDGVQNFPEKGNTEDADTGIHEVDLTVGDLTRQEEINRLRVLEEENAHLRNELDKLKSNATNLIQDLSEKDIFNLSSDVKEKIRDLEERLEKERDSTTSQDTSSSSESSSSDDEESESRVHPKLVFTHVNDVSRDVDKEPLQKDTNIIREKLQEIEHDLRLQHPSVLTRILGRREEEAQERMQVVQRLEGQLAATNETINSLNKQVADLQRALDEPDVRITMSADETRDPNKDVQVDQDEETSSIHESLDHSSETSSSSSESDTEVAEEDSEAQCAPGQEREELQEKTNDRSSPSLSTSVDNRAELERMLLAKDEEIRCNQVELNEAQNALQTKETELKETKEQLANTEKQWKETEASLESKWDELRELQNKFEQLLSDDVPELRAEADVLNENIESLKTNIAATKQERDQIAQQLNDVQRECSSLLEDNIRLEEEKTTLEDRSEDHASRIQEMEDLIAEREEELQQAQIEAGELQDHVNDLAEQLQSMQAVMDSAAESKIALQEEIRNLSSDHNLAVDDLKQEIKRLSLEQVRHAEDGRGDAQMLVDDANNKEGENEINKFEIDGEVERLTTENETLRSEIQNLTFKTEELQTELGAVRQVQTDEHTKHESEVSLLQMQIDQLSSPQPMEPQIVEEELQKSPPSMLSHSRSSSSSSNSSDEDKHLHTEMVHLKEEHQRKMDEIRKNFADELREAVEIATREQQTRDEARLSEVEEKHKKEIAELMSESITVDNELARRLRDELDLADKLDSHLIDQLQAISPDGGDQASFGSSPAKDAEISSRLQRLLSKLHSEGVQVLSLSELQFIKQHQSYLNTSAQTSANLEEEESSHEPNVDVEALKRSWENEKLALLDAIQALKELLIQTANEVAQSSDDADNLRWRGDFLRAIADLFERERRALLAELQASVIEAHGQAEANEEMSTASRLEELERKIRNQQLKDPAACSRVWDLAFTSELLRLRHEIRRLTSHFSTAAQRDHKHRSELERLLAADRDQLVEDITQLKIDRNEQLSQAHNRIQELQDQGRMLEDASKLAQGNLKQQLECFKSRLEQEQALAGDLRSSLDSEQQKYRSLQPTLERERERTLELSSEIVALNDRAAAQDGAALERIEALQSALEEGRQKLENAEEKLQTFQQESAEHGEELAEERRSVEEDRIRNESLITDLQAALETEEKRRLEAMQAVETERQNVTKLHQDLANERAAAYDDVIQLKNRCDDLSEAVKGEENRCSDLHDALQRESAACQQAREALESERAVTKEAREHDRATVADLQAILENARRESERVQSRVEEAEREREEALREAEEKQTSANHKLEIERASRDEAVARERRARAELQSALETEKIQKKEIQKRLKELEEAQGSIYRSPGQSNEGLLANRRQLESLRQRLQLEASKFQNLVDRTASRPQPRDRSRDFSVSPSASLLSSDGEKFESLKRSLQDMQGELKDLYSELSIPTKQSSARAGEFNDRLLHENGELAEYAAHAAREARDMMDAIASLEEEKKRQHPVNGREIVAQSPTQENQQKMASRMHKLYTRYLRAESFRKSLVYQKKYLLLLLGGFQDCEEATLALISRMGAYPSTDALRRQIPHRSPAFTRFRSAVRVVIAVQRLKFLVRKWKRASSNVSAAIHSKHGIPSTSAPPAVNGHHHQGVPVNQSIRHRNSGHLRTHPYDHQVSSRTPSPSSLDSSASSGSYRPTDQHYINESYVTDPPVHDTSSYSERHRASTSPYLAGASYAGNYGRDLSHASSTDRRHLSPSVAAAYASLDRSRPGESDPSLNEYIRKLENIQQKLGQGSYRYPR